MEIIFHGKHNDQQAAESLSGLIHLLKEKYHIDGFREMHLSITLTDGSGFDVELVDSETNQPYRVIEVYPTSPTTTPKRRRPRLKLVN